MAQICLSLFMVCQVAVADPAPTDDVQVEPEAPACDLPICGSLGERLDCIEFYESRHTGAALNRSSGARGWLQWLPATARQWGVAVGDRFSEWSAAARIAARGDVFFWTQWRADQRYCG